MQDLWQIFVWPLLLVILSLLITLLIYFAPRLDLKRLVKEKLSRADRYESREVEIREQTLRSVSLELHDKVGHLLTVALLQIDRRNIIAAHAPPDQVKRLLTEALQAVRQISSSLTADSISLLGLPEAIRSELELLKSSSHYSVNFHLEGEQFFLSEEIDMGLFRIFQEVITNIIRHARADHITVLLEYSKNSFRLQIADNGKGFDVGTQLNRMLSRGRGLSNIISRSRIIGGMPEILSRENGGTTISILIPMTNGKIFSFNRSHCIDR